MSTKTQAVLTYVLTALLVGTIAYGALYLIKLSNAPDVPVSPELIEEYKKHRDLAAQGVLNAEKELENAKRARDLLLQEQEMLKSQLAVRKIFDQRVDDSEVGMYQCQSSHMTKDFTGKSHEYAHGIVRVELDFNTISIDLGDRTVTSGSFETIRGSTIFASSTVQDETFYRTYGERFYPDSWYYEYQNKTERILITECIKL